jgi:hypothetical protein
VVVWETVRCWPRRPDESAWGWWRSTARAPREHVAVEGDESLAGRSSRRFALSWGEVLDGVGREGEGARWPQGAETERMHLLR